MLDAIGDFISKGFEWVVKQIEIFIMSIKYVFQKGINKVIEFLPSLEVPGLTEKIQNTFAGIKNIIEYVAFFLPVGDILLILGLIVVISNFHLVLFFSNWVIAKIRG